jgi:SSS family solute:Na+ symporter
MQFLDWLFVAGSVLVVLGIGLYTQSYMRSVADFLSAGRLARRYLLAVSRGEMGSGAVVYIGMFEIINHSGFITTWWNWFPDPILLVFGIFGFVVYRYRETRVLTLGQFYEVRYSRRLRLFSGFLGFFAGLLNFGIIPVIGARAMVYFLGFPAYLHLLRWMVPTYIVLMAVFLLINVFVVLSGGLITIMMTNCAEGIISQLLYLVIIFGLIRMFRWESISATLSAHPAGQSYINPLDSFHVKDFNVWLMLMGIAGSVYGTMAWQNQSSYNSAPLTAHEGVMGGLLGRWRDMGQKAVITLLAVCAMTYLHDPTYASGARLVHAELAKIGDPQVQEQMEIPVAITHLLPSGMRGALCAILLLGILGGDSTHLHSWGSLFIQDVVIPLRRRPFTPAQHIRLLRWSVVGVALFVFFFGIFFPLMGYIGMWWTVTMSIYIGGAGSVIIGGLYWKKGTTAGSWAGILTGFAAAMSGIVLQEIYGEAFPLNGAQISFFTMLIAIIAYAAVSLLTCREDFDMDRMLHRGVYARADGDDAGGVKAQSSQSRTGRITLGSVIGFDEKFTPGDKWIAGGLFTWTMMFFAVAAIGTLCCSIWPWPASFWSEFWHVTAIIIPIVISVITAIWFSCGGVADTIDLFRQLRKERINALDSGFVMDHQNLDERNPPNQLPQPPVEKEETTGVIS